MKKEREDKQSSLSRLTSLGEVHQKQVDDLMKGLDEQHKLVKFLSRNWSMAQVVSHCFVLCHMLFAPLQLFF